MCKVLSFLFMALLPPALQAGTSLASPLFSRNHVSCPQFLLSPSLEMALRNRHLPEIKRVLALLSLGVKGDFIHTQMEAESSPNSIEKEVEILKKQGPKWVPYESKNWKVQRVNTTFEVGRSHRKDLILWSTRKTWLGAEKYEVGFIFRWGVVDQIAVTPEFLLKRPQEVLALLEQTRHSLLITMGEYDKTKVLLDRETMLRILELPLEKLETLFVDCSPLSNAALDKGLMGIGFNNDEYFFSEGSLNPFAALIENNRFSNLKYLGVKGAEAIAALRNLPEHYPDLKHLDLRLVPPPFYLIREDFFAKIIEEVKTRYSDLKVYLKRAP